MFEDWVAECKNNLQIPEKLSMKRDEIIGGYTNARTDAMFFAFCGGLSLK
jgi:hypothetical protein